jgi:CheY-like chemotaxis protein
MGGAMTVSSVFGKGSTFAFTLDLPIDEAGVAPGKPLHADIAGAGILVIEDNPINRTILTEQMQTWGLECVAVEDGPTGLAFLREASRLGVAVDLVILDYQMPEMNGAAVARAIRGDDAIKHTPLLLLSSVDQFDAASFRGLNFQGQLSKPARSSLLLETITSIILSARHSARIEACCRSRLHRRRRFDPEPKKRAGSCGRAGDRGAASAHFRFAASTRHRRRADRYPRCRRQ